MRGQQEMDPYVRYREATRKDLVSRVINLAVAEAGSTEGAIQLLEKLREAERSIGCVALQAVWETPSLKRAVALLGKLREDGEAIALLAKSSIEAQSVLQDRPGQNGRPRRAIGISP